MTEPECNGPRGLARLLGELGAGARRRGGWILAACLVLTLPCLLLVSFPQIEMDPVSMFPRGDATLADLQYFADNFGLSGVLILLVREDAGNTPDSLSALQTRLKESGHFTVVTPQPLRPPEKGSVILAFPRESTMNVARSEAMLADVRAALRETGVSVEMTGAPVFVSSSRASLLHDIRRTGLFALALVIVLVLVTLRDPLVPLAAMVPVALGMAWGQLFARVAFDHMDFLVAGLPTTLIGVGIDYALYLRITRLETPAEAGPPLWRRVYGLIGPPLLVGVLTTAGAFFSLLFSNMRAFSQMGLIGGVTLTVIFAITMLATPILMDTRDRLGLRWPPHDAAWLGRLAHAAARARPWTIAVFALPTVFLLLAALRLTIGTNPKVYEDPDLPARRVLAELAAKMGLVLDPIALATPDLASERRVVGRLRSLVGPKGPFSRVECVTVYVEQLGIPAVVGARLLAQIDQLASQIPQARCLMGKDGRRCILLYPRVDPYQGDNLPRLMAALDTLRARCGSDIARVAGSPVIYDHFFQLIRGDLVRTGAAATVIVIAVLSILLRRVRDVAAAVVSLAGGIIWMLGAIQVAGQQITAANVIAMPLVVGLGIDYSVYIIYRMRTSSVERAVATTGRAVLIAGGATAVGFLALSLAHNQSMVGMGMAACVGVVSCLAWSMIFLPALIAPGQKAGGQ